MRKRLLAALTLVATGVWNAPALAAASATGVASATVIAPLTLRQTADLDFGVLTSAAASGSVTIAANGSTSYAGGARAVCGGSGAASACVIAHPARFRVHGEAGHGYTIVAPAQLSIAGSTQDGGNAPALTVSNLTVLSDSRPGAGAFGLVGADGADSFAIGATLDLPATLITARYRASFPVIVTYD